MRGSERLILLGIAIGIIGLILIAASSSSVETGFFFIFPFFAFGDISGPLFLIIVSAMAIMFVLFFLLPLRGFQHGWEARLDDQGRGFVRIVSRCEFCDKPIPEASKFCPSCGSPLREDSSDRYEPMY